MKKEFLVKIVFGWIKNDLERMKREIEVRPNRPGNINFPLALCTLAYMEYLGGFLRGEAGDFESNATEYIKLCFSHPLEYPTPIIEDLMRHGLAHEYFARGGISRDGRRPAIYKLPNNLVVLDAETLVQDFLASLTTFEQKLTDENYEKRRRAAEKRYRELYEQHKDVIDALPLGQQLPTTSTITSGASLSPMAMGVSANPDTYRTTTTLPYDKT